MSVHTLDLRKPHNSRAGRVYLNAAVATANKRAELANGYAVYIERGTRRSDGIREIAEVFVTPTRTAAILTTSHYKVSNTYLSSRNSNSGPVYPALSYLTTMLTNSSQLDTLVAIPALKKAVNDIITAIGMDHPREFLQWTAKGGDPEDVEGVRMLIANVPAEQALIWRHLGVSTADVIHKGRFHKISPTNVYAWQRFGMEDLDLIAQLCKDNVDPAAWFLSLETNTPLYAARLKPGTLGLSNSLPLAKTTAQISSTNKLLDEKNKGRTEVSALALAGSLAIAGETVPLLEAAEAARNDGWNKDLIVQALRIVDSRSAVLFQLQETGQSNNLT